MELQKPHRTSNPNEGMDQYKSPPTPSPDAYVPIDPFKPSLAFSLNYVFRRGANADSVRPGGLHDDLPPSAGPAVTDDIRAQSRSRWQNFNSNAQGGLVSVRRVPLLVCKASHLFISIRRAMGLLSSPHPSIPMQARPVQLYTRIVPMNEIWERMSLQSRP